MSAAPGDVACADAALAAGAALAGTATQSARWLLVEHAARWGHDAVATAELPGPVAQRLAAFDGRVLLLRRPGARAGAPAVFRADATEGGGTLRRIPVEDVHELATAELESGEPCRAPLLLVCAHGRRDRCCARLGPPVFDALRARGDPAAVWESSHQGGHRFAANVLVLPWGVQLGRVTAADAERVAGAVADGRIPLDLYRGRTLYEPRAQAADAAVRRALGLDRVDAVRLLADDGDRVHLSLPDGEAVAVVEEVAGPALPASCGDDPAPTTFLVARVESLP